jgi:hypothetical protein
MNTANEYRQWAAELDQKADMAVDTVAQKEFRELARRYRVMAEAVERRQEPPVDSG